MAKEIEFDGYVFGVTKDTMGDRVSIVFKLQNNNWDLLSIKVPRQYYINNLRNFDSTIPVKVKVKTSDNEKEITITIKLT